MTCRGIHRLGELALGVVGGRALPEPDRRRVLLVEPDQVGQQPGRAVDAEDQQPGRHRVERAGVPDLAGAERATGARRRRRGW